MMKIQTVDDDRFDVEADRLIAECVSAAPPTSFFLFAGAGSGKTRSLVKALQVIKEKAASRYRLNGRHIGVITFTKKARDEIKRRLEYDDLFVVSTIHSFAWSLITGLNHDIREWLEANLQTEIETLQDKDSKGRAGTKASIDRINTIKKKSERQERLKSTKIFIYSPDGDNPEKNALSHTEVIRITAAFLTEKLLLQRLLMNRFPILLIDESQDTHKELMEALFRVQANNKSRFALGVIGDTMQRIYTIGKLDLGSNLPADWVTPSKIMNHRSCSRIIELINKIREPVDGRIQQPRADKSAGFVRLFILPAQTSDKPAREREICRQMAEITVDEGWLEPEKKVKALILEHHMAANRLGFLPMWGALDSVDHLKTGLRDGTLPGLRFFSQLILPLLKAHQAGDKFAVASIVRNHSLLLEKRVIEECEANQRYQIEKAREAVNCLTDLWSNHASPTFLQVLKTVYETKLFELPESLKPFAMDNEKLPKDIKEIIEDTKNDEPAAWHRFLETPFEQMERYTQYIRGEAQYDTHQGVKGLEFPRVCVVIDDSEARGFTFSYDKLFKTNEDYTSNNAEHNNSTDQTRRLLYVTCSRAEESLALIAYTSIKLEEMRNNVVQRGWFRKEEVIL